MQISTEAYVQRLVWPRNQSNRRVTDTLASLTLLIASSKPDEMKTVKKLVISVLNRNR